MRDFHAPHRKDIKMTIEKVEKVILTKEEFNIIEKSLEIIEIAYNLCEEEGELERQTHDTVTLLRDFINNVDIE